MSNARFALRSSAHALSLAKSLRKLLKEHGTAWPIHRCQSTVARMLGYADLHELQATAGSAVPSPYDHEVGPATALVRKARQVSALIDEDVTRPVAEAVVTSLSPTALRDCNRLARMDVDWFLASRALRDLTGVDLAVSGPALSGTPALLSLAARLHAILASDPFAATRYARMYLPEGDGWLAGLVGDLRANLAHPLLPSVALAGLLSAMHQDIFFAALTKGALTRGLLSGPRRPHEDHPAFAGAMAAARVGDVPAFDAHLSAMPLDSPNLVLNVVGAALVYGLHALAATAVAEGRLGASPDTDVVPVAPTVGDVVFPYPLSEVTAWHPLAPDGWEEMLVEGFGSQADFDTDGYHWKRLDHAASGDLWQVGFCAEAGAPKPRSASRDAERSVYDFLLDDHGGLVPEVAVLSDEKGGMPIAYAAYRSGWRTREGRLEVAFDLGPCGAGSMPVFADILLAGVASQLALQSVDASWTRVDPRLTAPIVVGPRLGIHERESAVRDFMVALDSTFEDFMQVSWPIRIGEILREGGYVLKDEFPVESVRPAPSDRAVMERLVELMTETARVSGCEVSLRGRPDGTANPWIGEHEAIHFGEYDAASPLIRRLYAAARRPTVLRALHGLGIKKGLACPQDTTLLVGPSGSTSVMHRSAAEETLPWFVGIPASLVDLGGGRATDAARAYAARMFARDCADRMAVTFRGLPA